MNEESKESNSGCFKYAGFIMLFLVAFGIVKAAFLGDHIDEFGDRITTEETMSMAAIFFVLAIVFFVVDRFIKK
jgi:hypothetical protein